MKRILKGALSLMVALIGLIGLTSCNDEYDFYEDFTEAGVSLDKDTMIYEAITLDEAKAKIDADETFFLAIGTSQSKSTASNIAQLQIQADYLGFDGTIYFVDSTNYIEKKADRTAVREALGIHNITESTTSSLIIVVYKAGNIELDTSYTINNDYVDYDPLNPFLRSGVLDYEAIASYLFRDFQ